MFITASRTLEVVGRAVRPPGLSSRRPPLRRSCPAFVETVQAKRLDDLLTAESIPQVDIVKIDVEGAEQHVINGAPNLINKTKPIWFIELVQGRADNFTGSASDIFQQFIDAGYQAFILNDDYGWDQVTAISDATDYLFVPVATA